MSGTVEGPLVIADISGYTAFIADTELEHSREILSELLETLIVAMPQLRVAQLEGDAVCFVGGVTGTALLGWIEECFLGFHRRLRDIKTASTCTCRACSTVGGLTLKLVAHHGEYSWHRVGAVEQLVGTPVNVVHRLLKNHIPSHEYLFATDAVLARLTDDARAQFVPHAESYEHVGEIRGGYRDLAPLRTIAARPERGPVTAAESKLGDRFTIVGTPEDAWWVLSDPVARAHWMEQPHVELKPGARGHLLGAEYHCHHGKDKVTVFRVIDAQEPDVMTVSCEVAPGVTLYATSTVIAGAPATQLALRMLWQGQGGVRGRIGETVTAGMMRFYVPRWRRRMQALIADRVRARGQPTAAATSG